MQHKEDSVSVVVALCKPVVCLSGFMKAWSLLGSAVESTLLLGTSSLHLTHAMLQNGRPWPKGHGRIPLEQKAVEDC